MLTAMHPTMKDWYHYKDNYERNTIVNTTKGANPTYNKPKQLEFCIKVQSMDIAAPSTNSWVIRLSTVTT